MNIYLHQDRVLSIADACNALELLVLYGGLILCLPAGASRKAIFITGGIVLIEIMNVIRCTALVLLYLHRPEYVDFSHHYLFSFVVYGFIFWLWFLFSKDPRFAQTLPLNATTRQ